MHPKREREKKLSKSPKHAAFNFTMINIVPLIILYWNKIIFEFPFFFKSAGLFKSKTLKPCWSLHGNFGTALLFHLCILPIMFWSCRISHNPDIPNLRRLIQLKSLCSVGNFPQHPRSRSSIKVGQGHLCN